MTLTLPDINDLLVILIIVFILIVNFFRRSRSKVSEIMIKAIKRLIAQF